MRSFVFLVLLFATYQLLSVNAHGDPYIGCNSSSEVSGESIGTAGTRGTWKWVSYENGEWTSGGYINVCGYDFQISTNSGTTYFGEWRGNEFNGHWYKAPHLSCRRGNHNFACENEKSVPVADGAFVNTKCWGSFSFEILSGTEKTEAEGSWDYCGGTGGTSNEDLDAGPRPNHATLYERW